MAETSDIFLEVSESYFEELLETDSESRNPHRVHKKVENGIGNTNCVANHGHVQVDVHDKVSEDLDDERWQP